jgi:CheY-like chemotaxis protein
VPHTTTPPHVLAVEPDDDTRTLFATALRLIHCDVVEALDGRDALAKVLARVPALVLTEAALPFLDGYALCRVLRTDVKTRSVPILVITSEARPAELHRAREAGADIVLTKPIELDAVLAHATRLLRVGHPSTEAVASAPKTRVRAHSRFETTMPPIPPCNLRCPSCDRHLTYVVSYIGGVSQRHQEQWDTFTCVLCGTSFEYRHRTRRLRRIECVALTNMKSVRE